MAAGQLVPLASHQTGQTAAAAIMTAATAIMMAAAGVGGAGGAVQAQPAVALPPMATALIKNWLSIWQAAASLLVPRGSIRRLLSDNWVNLLMSSLAAAVCLGPYTRVCQECSYCCNAALGLAGHLAMPQRVPGQRSLFKQAAYGHRHLRCRCNCERCNELQVWSSPPMLPCAAKAETYVRPVKCTSNTMLL
jgi:hypothetical protein